MTAPCDISDRFAAVVAGEADPYPLYREARARAPIFWCEATASRVVTRHPDVARVLSDSDHFRPLPHGPGSSAVHGRVILHMEGREHTFHGALLGRWIRSRRRLGGELRTMAERITADILDGLPVGRPVDLHGELNTEMPMVMTATFMGIPEVAEFRPWYDAIGQASVSNIKDDPQVEERGAEARRALGEWLVPVLERKRVRPENDLLSDLCAARYQGEPLTDEAIASACSLLLAAGVETTSRALTNLQKSLLEEGLWGRLREERELVIPACAETLRRNPPAHGLVRRVTAPVAIAGQPLRVGEKMFALVGSANRDEGVFADPDRFLLDRFRDDAFRQFTPKSDILPFGAGTHHCTGSLLAQMEMEVVMGALLDRFGRAEFTEGVPPDTGYVLRAPARMPVALHPAA